MSIRERIDHFCDAWPKAEYGPAHVVISDYNLEDHWIDSCLRKIESGETDDVPEDELKATVEFLRGLRLIPEDERCKEFD